jgi:predicted DNA-binding transcriptional regulator
MKIELTEEFKKINLTKYPYSISAIIIYILTLEHNHGRIKIKVCEAFPKMGMSEATLVSGLKTIRKLGILERDGQSHYIINKTYINYDSN